MCACTLGKNTPGTAMCACTLDKNAPGYEKMTRFCSQPVLFLYLRCEFLPASRIHVVRVAEILDVVAGHVVFHGDTVSVKLRKVGAVCVVISVLAHYLVARTAHRHLLDVKRDSVLAAERDNAAHIEVNSLVGGKFCLLPDAVVFMGGVY